MKKLIPILLLAGTTLLSGCGDSDNFVFTNTNNPVLSAPVCQDDVYSVNQDTTLTVSPADGVLRNDTPNGGALTFQATSAQGGAVAGNQDGSFTYTPAAGFTGPDSFTYTVQNNAGSATCTVRITVIPVNGFFVDSVNGNDSTGSFNGGNPYQTIQAAVADAPTNADIVVRPGNYTGTVNLKDGQRLLGSGSALVSPQGATRPVLTGPVVLGDGCTLDFLRIANTPATVGAGDGNGDAVIGDGQDGGTVTNCEIDRPADEGVSAIGVTGDWNISNNTISEAGPATILGIGINLTTTAAPPNATDPTATARVNNNTVTDCTAAAIGFTSGMTSECDVQAHGNIMSGNPMGFTFEVIVGNTATFCLDLENNQNDDVYVLSNSDTGSVLNVEELVIGPPHSISSNTGTVEIDSGGGFSPPTPQMDGFCGF